MPSCADGGVLGVLPGIVGSLQALEVLKLILGVGEPLLGRLVLFDALAFSFRELAFKKDPQCAVCGPQASIRAPVDYEAFCGLGEQRELTGLPVLSVEELAARRRAGEAPEVLDVREPHERAIARDTRSAGTAAVGTAVAAARARFGPRITPSPVIRACAVSRPGGCCTKRVSASCRSWKAGWMPGPSASIPACRATDGSSPRYTPRSDLVERAEDHAG